MVFCEEYARGSFVVRALMDAGRTVRWVRGVETAFLLAERERVDVLVADAHSSDVLSSLVSGWRRRAPDAPVVLLSPGGDASTALADDVVASPLNMEAIEGSVARALLQRARA